MFFHGFVLLQITAIKDVAVVGIEVGSRFTVSACLTSGSDAVILRHPTSVKTIAAMLAALA